MRRGRFFLISGPSGVGKTSLVQLLRQRLPELAHSPSITTRPPRPGEVHGHDYLFVSSREFERLRRQGAFLETARVHGHAYGTSREDVQEKLRASRPVIKEVDVQGARQLQRARRRFNLVTIFILPPSWPSLVERLTGRGTEPPAQQARRLRTARAELAQAGRFDYLVINRDLEQATRALACIVQLEQRRRR